jgi:hypothetical protein
MRPTLLTRSLVAAMTASVVIAAAPLVAAAGPRNPPDPPAPTWNDPPPAGVETVKPIKPTWCAGYKPKPWLPGSLAYDEIKRGYSENVLKQIAELACDRPDDAGRQQWIAFYRQGWLNLVGTSEAEDREAMAARLQLDAGDRALAGGVCKRLWHPPADAAPADKLFATLRAQAIGCGGLPMEVGYGTDGGDGMATASYWIDRAAEPPDELVRLAWVLRCFNPGTSSIDPATAHRALGRWSMCGHDALALDRRRFDRAVDALGLPALGKVRAREMFAYTQKLLRSYRAAFKDLRAKDPDYGRILDEPEQGFAAWVKLRADNRAALDDALAMEDSFREGDKRKLAGCSESLRATLAAHIASLAPRTKDDVGDAANDDVGQPVLRALIACDSLMGRHGLVDSEMKLLGLGRLRRGPRTAAFWQTLDVVAAIAADRTKFPVQPASFGGPLPRVRPDDDWMHVAYEATFNETNWDRDQLGRVTAVKPDRDGVMVSFKTETWKEPVSKCTETNRIDRITAEGRVEYRQRCVAAGTRTVKVTPQPVWIRKDLAAGLKPGVFMKWRRDNKPKPAMGFPMEVYADQAQTKLIQFWGFAVTK